MTWLTYEQFMNLGKKCDKCDKPAKWLGFDRTWPVCCDDHYPYEEKKDEQKDE